MKVQENQLIAERYLVEGSEVRQGAIELWDAVDRQLQRPVTIQLLTEKASRNRDLRNTFLRHQQIACTIHDSAVQAVYDAGVWEGRPFSVMQKCDGVPASTLYHPGYPSDATLALATTRQVARGLQSCRDAGLTDWALAPETVQIDREGNAHFAIIEGSSSESNMESNTSDLAALSRLLRLMLAGDPEADIAELRSLPAQVPEVVINLVERLDAEERHAAATAGDVAAEIAAIEAASIQPTQAYEPESAIAAPASGAIEDGDALVSSATPIANDPSEAPTLVAPVLTPNQPYNPRADGIPQTSPLNAARVPLAPADATLPLEGYAVGVYAPPVENAQSMRSTRRSFPRFLPLAALLLLLVLALLLVKVLGTASRVEGQPVNSASNAPTPAQSAALVPDVRGKSLEDARSIAGAAGLNLVEADSAYDGTYPAGKVASQQPTPGEQIQAGSSITVSISLGSLPVVNEPAPNPPPKKGKNDDYKGKHK
jgi:hypothetical protein